MSRPPGPRPARVAAALATAAVAALIAGCAQAPAAVRAAPTHSPVARSEASPDVSAAAPASTTAAAGVLTAAPARRRPGSGSALAVLATLPIRPAGSITGYSRALFGIAWTDDNGDPDGHNGCDTRDDILRRDLTLITVKAGSNGCIVESGVLHDPYTGTSIAFTRGESTSGEVPIDHVVALGDAWETGAATWTATQRVDFANDPLELLAVDEHSNEAKGDADAAAWLPPTGDCAYAARQVAVKHAYGLWTTAAEHAALARVLATCPTQPLPVDGATPLA
jgi:hypothetical protein